jgi:hypothetical protein
MTIVVQNALDGVSMVLDKRKRPTSASGWRSRSSPLVPEPDGAVEPQQS